ncbi:MAG: hypothetical protein NUV91_07965 [Candidatus Omnitrophica bacterium]|nr:hypothetical protein [Candidatus Omnitrophota bacterium]
MRIIWILIFWASVGVVWAQENFDELIIPTACEQEYQGYCGDVKDFGSAAECLKKHRKEMFASCAEVVSQQVKKYDDMRKQCRKDIKKFCGIDLDRVGNEAKAKKMQECVVEHWGELGEGCRDYYKRSVPILDEYGDELDEGYKKMKVEQEKKEKLGFVKVAGTGKKVKVQEQEGDMIWYEAKLVKKKVVDQYEFCPPLPKERGLRVNEGSTDCGYVVEAPWAKEIVNKLNKEGLLEKITHLSEDSVRDKEDFERIGNILEHYRLNCPQDFKVKIFNDHYRKKQTIACEKVGEFVCPGEYIKTFWDEGILGCQKFNVCHKGLNEVGNPKFCADCYAGGVVDEMKGYPSDLKHPIVWCAVDMNPHKENRY